MDPRQENSGAEKAPKRRRLRLSIRGLLFYILVVPLLLYMTFFVLSEHVNKMVKESETQK